MYVRSMRVQCSAALCCAGPVFYVGDQQSREKQVFTKFHAKTRVYLLVTGRYWTVLYWRAGRE